MSPPFILDFGSEAEARAAVLAMRGLLAHLVVSELSSVVIRHAPEVTRADPFDDPYAAPPAPARWRAWCRVEFSPPTGGRTSLEYKLDAPAKPRD